VSDLGIESVSHSGARVKFLALGSSACRVLNAFFVKQSYMSDLCLAVDTDLRCLESLDAGLPKYCFGKNVFRGLSSGGDENLIKDAFGKGDAVLQAFSEKSDVLILLSGLGGGTGSGMLLSMAQMAVQTGAFVIVIPLLPFSFEGKNKSIRAQTQLKTLQTVADLVIPFNNDFLFQTLPPSATIKEAFAEGDRVISGLIQSFFLSLTSVESGAFVCNLSDFIQHFSEKPDVIAWGMSEGCGEAALEDALKQALDCPTLKTQLDNTPSQKAFVYSYLTPDIPLTALKNLNYELQRFLGIPELQVLNNCHTCAEGTQHALVFILIASSKKNLKHIRYRSKKSKEILNENVQIQFDFAAQGNDSYWDTPTYLRLGLKLEP
jgi:cell division GTPase FtsZ